MIRAGVGEGDKRLASGKRDNRTTHEDAPIEKARKSQEGVIAEEENNLTKLGDQEKNEEGIQRNLINSMEKEEEGNNPSVERELGRDIWELGSNSELLQL